MFDGSRSVCHRLCAGGRAGFQLRRAGRFNAGAAYAYRRISRPPAVYLPVCPPHSDAYGDRATNGSRTGRELVNI